MKFSLFAILTVLTVSLFSLPLPANAQTSSEEIQGYRDADDMGDDSKTFAGTPPQDSICYSCGLGTDSKNGNGHAGASEAQIEKRTNIAVGGPATTPSGSGSAKGNK